jgi:hypothetical protein
MSPISCVFLKSAVASIRTFLLPVSTTSLGAWSGGLAVPMIAGLAGIQLALQAALFGTPAPLGFDLSNGLIVTAGY